MKNGKSICNYYTKLLCKTAHWKKGGAVWEPSPTSDMELLVNINNSSNQFTIFAKRTINGGLGSKYDSVKGYISKYYGIFSNSLQQLLMQILDFKLNFPSYPKLQSQAEAVCKNMNICMSYP